MASGQNNGLIYVGIPRERFLITSFVDNRDRILAALHGAGRECGYFQADGHRVDRNRDGIVGQFLAHEEQPEWLLMLDSDMEHPPECGLRLSQWRDSAKVIGALYFHRGQQHDPVAFRQAEKQQDKYGRMVQMWEPIRDIVYSWLNKNRIPRIDGSFTIGPGDNSSELIEVDAVGTGCILIHRSILERMTPPWFEYRDGSQSEDLEFCQRVRNELGEKIHVDLTTICGHYNTVAMGQAQFRLIHEGRGLSLTTYTPQQAAEWIAEFQSIDLAEASKQLADYKPSQLATWWDICRPKSDAGVNSFYESFDAGQIYLLDLLHWNASPSFVGLRRQLLRTRGQRILDFGGGIGTLAIQIALQENEVFMVELNRVLRAFAEWRWNWTKERVVSRHGSLHINKYLNWGGVEFDLITAIDVFEHLPEETLGRILDQLSSHLKIGGRLFYHNNFRQQDIYPMHFDHSEIWGEILDQAGLFRLDDLWAVKIK